VKLINNHKEDIERTDEYFNKNNLLMDNLMDILGDTSSYIEQKVTWNLIFEKIRFKIVFFMYLDNENTKNIVVDVKENNKDWKKTKVDKKQLFAFLDKHKNKFKKLTNKVQDELVTKIDKMSLKRNKEEEDDEDELVKKFSKVKLDHHMNMSKIYSDISNTYSKLFIKIDKQKKYEIQACKKM
jgi:hypothetical protein